VGVKLDPDRDTQRDDEQALEEIRCCSRAIARRLATAR